MKCLQVGRYPDLELLDLPIPVPTAGQIVMKVDAVATCPQWDLHLRHDEPMFKGHTFQYPYTPGQPGHEATGTVHSIGDGVEEFATGDRISAWRDAGHHVNGCYAEYVALPALNAIKVPSDLPSAATASVELAMCVAASFLLLKDMNAIAGSRFAVNGLGPAGLVAAQMARAEGAASIAGFDTSGARCGYALDKGLLDYAGTPGSSEDYLARPQRTSLDNGIDCVGAKASVEWLMDRVAGAVALFGVQREDYTFAVRHYHPALRLCGYPGHSREAAEYAVDLIAAGKLDLSLLITHTLPMERYNEGIDLLERQEAIKILFIP